MEILQNFHPETLLNTLICLIAAFFLGALIGLERQYRQRNAGLRTNVLVSVGAAVFVDLANRLGSHEAAVHVIAYVVYGVGFLGAGTIMKEGADVRGLNTAATLWGSAAVGACAGASLLAEAILAAFFVLSANTLLRPAVNWINRKPIDEKSSEMTYVLCAVAPREEQKAALATVEALLEGHHYPVADLDVQPFGDDGIEITATLLATSVDSAELDDIVAHLVAKSYIEQAYWNSSASD
ncbi:MgtC/SapB family protein [Uliginosibacterium gangwonense]|uniref:MgtC/SapB family protein n=1 Tax=Uliginosibacterium gangwonense TaxID=392736 RepID=UPI0004778370|nr:MgtC/SapB family protein [Uliginosibacterium gangwonense]